MKEKYPVVKMDRTTMQEFMPILMNKGIFSNYLSLPIKEEILETEKQRLGVKQLAPELERSILSEVGYYRTSNFVVRDFGSYAIAFSAKLYMDYLGIMESELLNQNSQGTDKIENGLNRVRLYKLAHRLVLIILAKVYENKRYTQLEITKQEMLDLLGFTAAENHIYRYISDALFSLSWLNYQIFRYGKKTMIDPNCKAFGTFIYNLVEDPKRYVIDVNEKFVGCVTALFNDRKDNFRENFIRGYLSYPTSIIPATKEYSTPAYLLTHFLITENGNCKLNDKNYKVVAFTVERFEAEMNIRASRASRRKKEFLEALQEVGIISDINPALADLTNKNPLELEKTVVYIKIKREINDLDSFIKSNLLSAN